jgi:DNA-binding response OmpR family regulator
MRVLIVEDDRILGTFLKKGLMLEGHDVDCAADGDAAVEMAAQQNPDLMVLDLGLPLRDGTEVLEMMRTLSPDTAVLVLTGRSQVNERVRCLDLGADDVVLKPFSLHELMARCRALIRRRQRFADPILRFGGIDLNRMERAVSYEGVRIDLTAKEFNLLEVLMLRKGVSCSRSELLAHVWHSAPETGPNIVDVYITYLRKKLAAAHPGDRSAQSAIETVRGTGYRVRDKRKVPRFEAPHAQELKNLAGTSSPVEFARGA